MRGDLAAVDVDRLTAEQTQLTLIWYWPSSLDKLPVRPWKPMLATT